MERLKSKIAVYPPAIPRRGPGHSFYQRGRGSGYSRVGGGVTWGRKRSERLGANWRVKTSRNRGVLYNRVSYSQFVVGKQQTSVHAAHGWPSAFTIAKDFIPEAERMIQRYTERELQRQGDKL